MTYYLDLVAKVVCNHGDKRNANYCDRGKLPCHLNHKDQRSKENY